MREKGRKGEREGNICVEQSRASRVQRVLTIRTVSRELPPLARGPSAKP